ncbi:hypothetical protein LGT39_12575 [Demequina sp. TTPB684]|uniref:hypothetical protein n=1 Tax=unclassified Demequina TaxID=2620311 RepID=UPI001CF3A4AC|nr:MULTISPECIES: hypothetical protein [unclassified Demequina]MCB2413680.1 hypothetical protein [Demequina sp. TTPB684]UPU87742.1 hypothetical protein LGT36_010830 [Demequina sp. TMPB413]
MPTQTFFDTPMKSRSRHAVRDTERELRDVRAELEAALATIATLSSRLAYEKRIADRVRAERYTRSRPVGTKSPTSRAVA